MRRSPRRSPPSGARPRSPGLLRSFGPFVCAAAIATAFGLEASPATAQPRPVSVTVPTTTPSSASPSAPPSSDATEAADRLFQEGRQRMTEKRYGEACPKFEQASVLHPGIGIFLNLGDCLEKVGRIASAWQAFGKAAELARARSDARELVAAQRQAALEAKLRRVVVTVPPEDDAVPLVVSIDGAPADRAAYTAGVLVDPGVHQVEVSAPGYPAWRAQADATAANASVTAPVFAPQGGAPPPPQQAEAPVKTATGLSRQQVTAIGIGGVGLAALVVGAVFGLESKSAHDDADVHCTLGPNGNQCDGQGVASRSDALHEGNASTAAFVVAAAALGGSAVLWLTAPRGGTSVGLVPALGGVGVRGAW